MRAAWRAGTGNNHACHNYGVSAVNLGITTHQLMHHAVKNLPFGQGESFDFGDSVIVPSDPTVKTLGFGKTCCLSLLSACATASETVDRMRCDIPTPQQTHLFLLVKIQKSNKQPSHLLANRLLDPFHLIHESRSPDSANS